MKIDHQALAALIGEEIVFQERRYLVIDVLLDEPAVVLQPVSDDPVIQGDQFGEPRRRVPRTLTLPVGSEGDARLHPALVRFSALIVTD